jgi:hypothetical protein
MKKSLGKLTPRLENQARKQGEGRKSVNIFC